MISAESSRVEAWIGSFYWFINKLVITELPVSAVSRGVQASSWLQLHSLSSQVSGEQLSSAMGSLKCRSKDQAEAFQFELDMYSFARLLDNYGRVPATNTSLHKSLPQDTP